MPNAEQRALSALTQVNNIGFPEFTAKLINDTTDAIIGATIRQLKSYTELVAELEQGIDAFKAKAVNDESVAQYMKDAFPADKGETAVAVGRSYNQALYQQILNRLGEVKGLTDPGDGELTFSEEQVAAIQAKVRAELDQAAERSFEQLRIMVQMGYARVVFTEGRIKSKLTFDVEARDYRTRTSSDIAQSAFRASAGMKGDILGAILSVSGSTSYRSIKVRTVNTRAVEADRISGEILGEVEIKFATQTFPTVEVEGAPAQPETDTPA